MTLLFPGTWKTIAESVFQVAKNFRQLSSLTDAHSYKHCTDVNLYCCNYSHVASSTPFYKV